MTTELDMSAVLARIPKAWGRSLGVREGWYKIVYELDQQLAQIDPTYEVFQIKQKFGELRYYCSIEDATTAAKLISKAYELALKTCELCGKVKDDVETSGPGWITTLCQQCRVFRDLARTKL